MMKNIKNSWVVFSTTDGSDTRFDKLFQAELTNCRRFFFVVLDYSSQKSSLHTQTLDLAHKGRLGIPAIAGGCMNRCGWQGQMLVWRTCCDCHLEALTSQKPVCVPVLTQVWDIIDFMDYMHSSNHFCSAEEKTPDFLKWQSQEK